MARGRRPLGLKRPHRTTAAHIAAMQAQLAARHNAEEFQEAYKDILRWSRKQKHIDCALSKSRGADLTDIASEEFPG